MSLPTIALVYIVRLAGHSWTLHLIPVLGNTVCTVVSDSWFIECAIYRRLIRRYMIDIHSQDFVRFASFKGIVGEREISRKHIFKMRWFHQFLWNSRG